MGKNKETKLHGVGYGDEGHVLRAGDGSGMA